MSLRDDMYDPEYPVLEKGGVAYISNAGNGLIENNKGLYCVIEEYNPTGYYGSAGYRVSKYEHDLVAHNYEKDWVGVRTFGENPLVLLNTNEGCVVDPDYVAEGSKEEIEILTQNKTNQPEYTGGSSSYYKVLVKNPTTLSEPYEAECNDIIEALEMNFAEGNAFKAIWRKAKARQGVVKKGYDNGLYDSEKVVFFGERMVVEAKSKSNV